MKPTVGRIVHLVDSHGEHHAAIVTAIYRDSMVLSVFHHDAERPVRITSVSIEPVEGAEGYPAYTWHWPERE